MPTKPDREVERMAKLLFRAGEQWSCRKWGHREYRWEDMDELVKEKYRALARAVLADRAKTKRRTTRART